MVFGVECAAIGLLAPADVASKIIESCYLGRAGTGIHLIGPLAEKVIRVSPPLTITINEARQALDLLSEIVSSLAADLGAG